MNGRIHDPVLGRFMTPDPYIQSPDNLQSYNRYSYVLNNPLMYTDPSGYFSFKSLFKAAAIAVVSFYTGGAASAWYLGAAATCSVTTMTIAAVVNGVAGGFTAGLIASGGDFRAGVQRAVSGAIFGGIGDAASAGG